MNKRFKENCVFDPNTKAIKYLETKLMNFKTALWEKLSQVNGFKLLKRKEF